jgi:transcriptional regulator GlxA family with amidase domain
MPGTHKMALHTTDLAEAVNAISLIYCPREVGLRGSSRGLRVTLRQSDVAAPRVVREAEHFMRTDGPETSVSKIAARVGVSLRSLETGFREWRQSTPTQCLRKIRLDAARAELLAPSEFTTVTSVALANGFFHLARFSAYYRAAFGEPPGRTLRRSRLRTK